MSAFWCFVLKSSYFLRISVVLLNRILIVKTFGLAAAAVCLQGQLEKPGIWESRAVGFWVWIFSELNSTAYSWLHMLDRDSFMMAAYQFTLCDTKGRVSWEGTLGLIRRFRIITDEEMKAIICCSILEEHGGTSFTKLLLTTNLVIKVYLYCLIFTITAKVSLCLCFENLPKAVLNNWLTLTENTDDFACWHAILHLHFCHI